MAQSTHNLDALPRIADANVVIIRSKWYGEFCEMMTKKCLEVFEHAGCPLPKVHTLPGCVELPLAARRLCKNDPNLEAIIAFGIILKGDTYHFDMVRDTCFRGFEQVMFEHDIPIINEVLPVTKIEDAEKRCGDNDLNKGIEAAVAALEVIQWRRENNTTS